MTLFVAVDHCTTECVGLHAAGDGFGGMSAIDSQDLDRSELAGSYAKHSVSARSRQAGRRELWYAHAFAAYLLQTASFVSALSTRQVRSLGRG